MASVAKLMALGTALAAITIATPSGAWAQNVGKMTAERASVTKAGVGRIGVGADIALGDRLSSNASGSGMVVFLDESSARLGPNADLTIDEFVYNPQRRSGTIRLRQRAGSARIFGGQISKRGTSEVRTPHIVLGVRGGIADIAVLGGRTVTTRRAGIMERRVGNQRRVVTNPGISCFSDGRTLQVDRIEAGSRRFVDPGSGQGNSAGRTAIDHCASAPGVNSAACRTRDTGLPTPQPGGGGGPLSGGVPGSSTED